MLKRMILNTLLMCHQAARTMPSDLLKKECEMQAGGRIGDADYSSAMGALQEKQMISFVVDAVTDDRKYFITDLGRAQL